MQPIVLGRDTDKVIVTSDQHLAPRDIINIPAQPNNPLSSPANWIYLDILTKPDENLLRIWNGDGFHTHPRFWFEKELVTGAMSYLTNLLVKKDITGENLRVIPGNHMKVEHLPTDVVAEWLQRGILVEEGKLEVFDPATKISFHIQHGHEAQPWTVYPLFADNPILQRAAEKALTLARKSGLLKPHVYPYADAEQALKFRNAAQAKYTQANFDEPLSTAVYGHTHVTGFYPEKRFFNTGFRDPIHNWAPKLTISRNMITLEQRSLAAIPDKNYMRNELTMSQLADILTNRAGNALQRDLGFVSIGD